MSVRYAVIFEQAESNWAAYVPDLPGCMTTGVQVTAIQFGWRSGNHNGGVINAVLPRDLPRPEPRSAQNRAPLPWATRCSASGPQFSR